MLSRNYREVNMPIFHSHAFWFLIGFFIGFVCACIFAAAGRGSRMEEELKRRQRYLASKQMVSDVEDILGRKTG